MINVSRELVGELESLPPIPVYEYALRLTESEYQTLKASGLFELYTYKKYTPPTEPEYNPAYLEFGGLE